MIKFPVELRGVEAQKYSDYSDFVASLDIAGCQKNVIGVSSDDKDIYSLTIGDSNNPVIFIQGCIHGNHEWACAHWVRDFIKILASPPPELHRIVKLLLSKYSFYTIPMLNTYGYFNTTYTNANGVDLNRNFDAGWHDYPPDDPAHPKGPSPFSEPESQIVRDEVLRLKPIMFIDCHTRGNSFIGITAGGAYPYDYLIRDMTYSAGALLNVNVALQPQSPISVPRSSNWVSLQESKNGMSPISFYFETAYLVDDTEKVRQGINGLMVFSYYAYLYSQDRKLILN